MLAWWTTATDTTLYYSLRASRQQQNTETEEEICGDIRFLIIISSASVWWYCKVARELSPPLHQYVLHLPSVSIIWHIAMLPGMPPSCSRSRSMSPDNTGTYTQSSKSEILINTSLTVVGVLLFNELVNNWKSKLFNFWQASKIIA